MGGGGEGGARRGLYSYIHAQPDEFFFQMDHFNFILKETRRAECEHIKHTPQNIHLAFYSNGPDSKGGIYSQNTP